MDRLFFVCGGVAGFIAAALGAFAAHGLKDRATPEMTGLFETALRYQAYHALALFAAAWGWVRWRHRAFTVAGFLFIAGIILFCGSIYAHVLADAAWLGALAPFGGMALLTGWLCLAVGAWRGSSQSSERAPVT
jgi:uncharacterized membrane protein YgdD (TMEM256/DUF423 family)